MFDDMFLKGKLVETRLWIL